MKERLKHLFGENTIFQASLLISFFILVARILGLVRDRILASHFGAGNELDTFFAAFRLPDLMFNLIIIGSFASAFIPIFMELKLKDQKEDSWRLVSILLNLLLFLWLIGSILVFAFAPYFVKIIAPGFSGTELETTIHLTRLLLLSPLFLGISTIAGSVLNAHKRFFLTALAPSLYNIGIIVGALFFAPSLGMSGLAWGVILGAFLHFVIQWGGVLKLNFKYFWDFNFFNPHVKTVIKLAIPRVFTTSIYQLNLWVQTAVASFMLGGSISVLNFGQNIQALPVSLVGVALSSAIFPTLTEIALRGGKEEMRAKIIKALKIILLVIVPLSLFLILLRAQAVRVILGAGRFDWMDTYLTAKVVGYFSISLFAQCFVFLLNQSFFAFKDTRTPLKAAFWAFIANFVLIFLLTSKIQHFPHLGIEGIALAFSLASILEASILILNLKTKIGSFGKEIVSFGFKILILSLVSGVFVQLVKTFLGNTLNLSFGINVLLQGLISLIVGSLIFIFLAYFSRVRELEEFKRFFAKKAL